MFAGVNVSDLRKESFSSFFVNGFREEMALAAGVSREHVVIHSISPFSSMTGEGVEVYSTVQTPVGSSSSAEDLKSALIHDPASLFSERFILASYGVMTSKEVSVKREILVYESPPPPNVFQPPPSSMDQSNSGLFGARRTTTWILTTIIAVFL